MSGIHTPAEIHQRKNEQSQSHFTVLIDLSFNNYYRRLKTRFEPRPNIGIRLLNLFRKSVIEPVVPLQTDVMQENMNNIRNHFLYCYQIQMFCW